jgi:hypothetical protein
MPSTTEKQALFGKSQADRDASNAYWQKVWGNRIINSGAAGLGLGMGGTGLYYLYKGLMERQQPQLVEDTDEEVTTDAEAFGPDKKRKKAAKTMAETVGGMLPTSWIDVLGGLGNVSKGPRDPNVTREAFGNTALVGGAGAGLLGGHYLMKSLYNKKKKQDLEEEVADAAKEYHAALMNKKVKRAADDNSGVRGAVDTTWDATTQLPIVGPLVQGVSSAVSTPYVMTGAGLGALSMYLMYERARGLSRSRAAEAAAKSKARLGGVASDYVDPEELAAIKRMA